MKILQVLPTLDPSVGGVAPAVTALSRGMMNRGHTVDLLTVDDPSASWLDQTELNVHAVGPGLTSYRYSSKLLSWLREHGTEYDRVIANGLWQYPNLAVWKRFGASKTPYYVFPHGMLDPWFKRTYPLKHLKKWCYWPWAEYRVMRDAAAVIYTSEQERIEARESFWLYRCREKISPLGVTPPPAVPESAKEIFLAKFPQLRDKGILLFLGRLHVKKGCDIAIEAMSRVPDSKNFVLVFAGPDQVGWERQLRDRAREVGLNDRVVFTGMLGEEMKQSAFAAADALILPSHQENFGMAVVEALAAGLPVLISNRINIWREVESDGAGYVENDDVAGTIALIQRWLSTSSQQRDVMRSNARRSFTNRFEIDRAVDSLLNILFESSDREMHSSPTGRGLR